MQSKRFICVLMCIISCLLFISSSVIAMGVDYDIYAPSYTTYDTTYDAILKMYLRVIEARRKNQSEGRHDLFNDNIYWEVTFENTPDALNKQAIFVKSTLGYAITDINGDGIDELIIGSKNANVYEVFTMDNGKVRELIRAGARYRCSLLKDGTFWRFGSSGAAFYGYYAFKMNGTNPVQFVKGYHYNGEFGVNNGFEDSDCWFKANSDKGRYQVTLDMHVSTSEVDQWVAQCEANLSTIRFIPLVAYEQGLDGKAIGILSYNGKTEGRQTINIRKKPSKNSKLVTTKRVGTYVSVLGMDGDYYQISFGSTTGYVQKDFLTLLTEMEDITETESEQN